MRQIRLNILLLFLVVSLMIFFLDSRNVLNPVRSAVQVVAAPVTFAVYQTKLGMEDFFSFATFWKSGEARIKNLEQRNLELVAFENRTKDLEKENRELRKQLAVSPYRVNGERLEKNKLLPATVLGVGQYLEIGVGEKDNVRTGLTVVYLNNLVGKVIRVTDRESFVQLPTDSLSKIPVKIDRVFGLAIGQFNGAVLLDRVAQNEEINVSDLVVTSGEGGSYEPDLMVGKIKKIVSQETDLFKQAEVESLVDYNKLMTVFVMLK